MPMKFKFKSILLKKDNNKISNIYKLSNMTRKAIKLHNLNSNPV